VRHNRKDVSGEISLKTAGLAPNKTVVAPARFIPVISTRVPSGPLIGEMAMISGGSTSARPEIETRSNADVMTRPADDIAIATPAMATSRFELSGRMHAPCTEP